ncbi:hypothetical protein ACJIZ3_012359 [Penstemon smallii]|uniref:Proline-rich protein PRCC n=1 Tax=Penstemon smallii TaxID=265156 RepID=A0ABD3UQD9_9LAMI
MDSLCANYASSDEEEQEVPDPQLLKPSAKPLNLKSEAEVDDEEKGFNSNSTSKPGGILNSLPPPKSSLFNSLPPPKSQSFPNPNLQPKIEQRREEQFLEIPKPKSSSSSLFSSLPPPSAPSSSNNSRRVVQFKPPTIQNPYSSKIDDEDDEDDEGEKEKQRKRLKESLSTSSASSFLSSIPAPRYSGSLGTLGTGRKSMFETVAQVSTETIVNAKGSNSVGSADVSSVNMAQNNGGLNSNVVVSEVNQGETNYDYSAGHGMSVGSGDVDCMYGNGQHVEYSHAGDSYVDYGDNVQYENNWANETALPEVSAVISELRVPGKRGRKDAPLEIVEVKQDELMKNRPRQDQVKSTGIAFGPAYQPTSSKGKPTKLHKRKHQIGSLYFDLKQKETELAERRSQGFQTKAQTQAKYGW